MTTPRLETARDLVKAVLRSKTVDLPLRTLHRAPRSGTLEEVAVGWSIGVYSSDFYDFTRDGAWVQGSAAGLAMLGVYALAQAVALEDAPVVELKLAARPGPGFPHACVEVRVHPPAGPRPILRAPRWDRAPVPRRAWRPERVVDRPQLGLVRAAGPCGRLPDFEARDVFTIGGTRGGLRALAFLLFDLATDRGFDGAIELEGPEGWDNLAVPSCAAKMISPYAPISEFFEG